MKARRTRKFIDSVVQGSLVRRIALHWFIFFALAFLMLPLWRMMTGAELVGSFSELMLRGWWETAPIFVILLALLPVFLWDTVTLSHRFAGPMYRFQDTVKRLAAGEDVPPIRLRKRDFWKEFAADLNSLMERMDSECNQAAQITQDDEPVAAACDSDAGN